MRSPQRGGGDRYPADGAGDDGEDGWAAQGGPGAGVGGAAGSAAPADDAPPMADGGYYPDVVPGDGAVVGRSAFDALQLQRVRSQATPCPARALPAGYRLTDMIVDCACAGGRHRDPNREGADHPRITRNCACLSRQILSQSDYTASNGRISWTVDGACITRLQRVVG